jgi:hypothetical protein
MSSYRISKSPDQQIVAMIRSIPHRYANSMAPFSTL